MSLSKFVPEISTGLTPHNRSTSPDYNGLVRFLMQPFLENPQALKIDSEVLASNGQVWIRLAFEETDKGRVFGRGGRNIQAIRTVLDGLAKSMGQTVNLDIYGGLPSHRESSVSPPTFSEKTRSERPRRTNPSPKLRDR